MAAKVAAVARPALARDGATTAMLNRMQTRKELYESGAHFHTGAYVWSVGVIWSRSCWT